MYVDLYDNFNDISTIPDKLKKSLNNELEFSPLKLVLKKNLKIKVQINIFGDFMTIS